MVREAGLCRSVAHPLCVLYFGLTTTTVLILLVHTTLAFLLCFPRTSPEHVYLASGTIVVFRKNN